ncbi:hypothetical protein A2276_02880 [candidate division WOR-1 bacterium RIFOXYA12_FULL_43_27]|uniref:L,D-TPase catalytic domain-containing protein n=1 Tax=candidate division WOR-1 bacterium RIFOXYC2_FULL_46_14 TaxID=1802587 RepID=A0A1F4U7T2_UNCSA|nr:MAG: hypothetical protein A2276_02880 [candidate division WOR-1 bacterium RIFOXYA12_FULL_43_27]OGC19349.1 MAG: hypothetical protein A2292_01455 [candidate division WOR-1 bacterium RIFOXYB2_FULL_46_45]OGC30338.1 MAG: hypothetical protein A2232_01455 [candidate division WOR-1 bacterium RIFOXYA2_FULL_46_56]OGC40939.1 MAG: hypothetical protein A2438_01455 [candidate division WOR-1 bacterium RIFOXYC2_FULL_46_14]
MKQTLLVTLIIAVIALASQFGLGIAVPDLPDGTIISTDSDVVSFVEKHKDKECLVVDKDKHLLYYVRNGRLVKNFPVPIAIGMGGFYKTPSGEFKIDGKNPNSRFTKFLKLNIPYSIAPYGIHAGPTYLAKKYEKLELQYPGERFVTKKDDTRGCVAVETSVMRYLFERIEEETPVLIL